MTPTPSHPDFALEEYRALRATIRERGTARQIVSALTFVAWAAGALWLSSHPTSAALTLIPLVVLAAGFEVIFAAHVGVERIGRYIQTTYEHPDSPLPAWEQTAMRFGALPGAATSADPLLVRLFTLTTLVNLLPIALAQTTRPAMAELGQIALVVLVHLAFALRVFQAQRFAHSQRARDLDLFKQLGK